MRKSLVLAIVVLAVAAGAVWAQLTGASPQTTLDRARIAWEKRADPIQSREAVDLFQAAAAAEPTSYEALWEGARACYFYGYVTRESAPDSEKMQIFTDGIERARRAVALRPDAVEGHFWLGVLLGVYGEAKGIFKSLSLVPEIKAEMERCLKLDPAVEGWGPDRLLGRMYYKLPFFKGGDNNLSREHLERSLAGAPGVAETRVYLAETYKSLGRKADAIAQLRTVLTMTPDPQSAPEHPTVKARAEVLLKKWS